MAVIPVFVSSTFRDFHGERDVLGEGVRERLDELVRDVGCRVEIIDLRWGVDTIGVDEEQAARRVVDVCLQQVKRAQPLFVGLVGDRVGYVPDAEHARWVADRAGVPADQAVEGLSVTELEFGFGMLWPSAPPGEHVVVFRDIDGPAPKGWVDPDRARVAAFRSLVTKRARELGAPTLGYQTTVDQDTATARLDVVRAGSERVSFEDLMVDALTGPVRGRAQQVIADSQDQWAGAERLFRDNRQVTVGRQDLVADLTTQVVAGARVVLVGESGSGKSTIVCAVEKQLASASGVRVVSALVGAMTGGVSDHDVMMQVAGQLTPILGRELQPPQGGDDEAFMGWWGDMLVEAAAVAEGQLVVVIDALDAMAGTGEYPDIKVIHAIPPAVAVLASTTQVDHSEAFAKIGVEPIGVGDLPAEVAAQAAQRWAEHSGRRLPGRVVAVIGSAPRSPLWVRLAVDLLADLDGNDFAAIAHITDQAAAIESVLWEKVTTLPGGARELAEVFLGRVGERIGTENADLLLGVLATARSGVAPADLARLLPGQDGSGLVAVMQRVLGDQLRETDASGRLTFAHAALQSQAAAAAGTDIHIQITGLLATDSVWDNIDALDAIWHSIHASAKAGPSQREQMVAPTLLRAVNSTPRGGELLLMQALDIYPDTGIGLVTVLDGTAITDGGTYILLSASGFTDRRYLQPARRLELSWAVLAITRAGERTEITGRTAQALINVGNSYSVVGNLRSAEEMFREALEIASGLGLSATSELKQAANGLGAVAHSAGDLAAADQRLEASLASKFHEVAVAC